MTDRPEVSLGRDVEAVRAKLGRITGMLSEAASAAGAAEQRKGEIGAAASGVEVPDRQAIKSAQASVEALL